MIRIVEHSTATTCSQRMTRTHSLHVETKNTETVNLNVERSETFNGERSETHNTTQTLAVTAYEYYY